MAPAAQSLEAHLAGSSNVRLLPAGHLRLCKLWTSDFFLFSSVPLGISHHPLFTLFLAFHSLERGYLHPDTLGVTSRAIFSSGRSASLSPGRSCGVRADDGLTEATRFLALLGLHRGGRRPTFPAVSTRWAAPSGEIIQPRRRLISRWGTRCSAARPARTRLPRTPGGLRQRRKFPGTAACVTAGLAPRRRLRSRRRPRGWALGGAGCRGPGGARGGAGGGSARRRGGTGEEEQGCGAGALAASRLRAREEDEDRGAAAAVAAAFWARQAMSSDAAVAGRR